MKSVCIISEYNPLHTGHIYQIKKTRHLLGNDIVCISLMSGNFVQRGEAAIADKWTRVKWALDNGIDLVIEIPTLFSIGSAKIFAKSGVSIAESIGSDYISFGMESDSMEELNDIANYIKRNEQYIEKKIKNEKYDNTSYPKATYDILKENFTGNLDLIKSPNNILAIEYLKNIKKIKPVGIKRVGADYMELDEVSGYMSATGIRDKIKNTGKVEGKFLGKGVAEDISSKKIEVVNKNLFLIIKYLIISKNAAEIDEKPSAEPGIGFRLKKAVKCSDNIDELILHTKSKRYTYSRISRLIIELLLDIDRDFQNIAIPEFARVLGVNQSGRDYIRYIKSNNKSTIPIMTNINKENKYLDAGGIKILNYDIKATEIYSMLSEEKALSISDFTKHMIVI